MGPRAVSVLAFVIVLGFFGIVGTLIFHEVPVGSKDVLGPLIGVIGAAVGTIVGFIWGSSSGSKAHSQTVKELTGTGDGSGTTSTKSKTVTEKEVVVESTTAPAIPAWLTATPYKLGDVVTVGASKYRALADHTSAITDEPGVGNDWSGIWERQA